MGIVIKIFDRKAHCVCHFSQIALIVIGVADRFAARKGYTGNMTVPVAYNAKAISGRRCNSADKLVFIVLKGRYLSLCVSDPKQRTIAVETIYRFFGVSDFIFINCICFVTFTKVNRLATVSHLAKIHMVSGGTGIAISLFGKGNDTSIAAGVDDIAVLTKGETLIILKAPASAENTVVLCALGIIGSRKCEIAAEIGHRIILAFYDEVTRIQVDGFISVLTVQTSAHQQRIHLDLVVNGQISRIIGLFRHRVADKEGISFHKEHILHTVVIYNLIKRYTVVRRYLWKCIELLDLVDKEFIACNRISYGIICCLRIEVVYSIILKFHKRNRALPVRQFISVPRCFGRESTLKRRSIGIFIGERGVHAARIGMILIVQRIINDRGGLRQTIK